MSDLGAWNSRNVDWPTLEHLRDRILRFPTAIGINGDTTTLRGHQDHDNLVLAGLIAKLLTEADFRANRESLDEVYQGLVLGIMVDGLYTIADILGPLREGYTRVLMVAGVEEHYFADLAQLVLTRAAERYPGQLFPADTAAAAVFLDVVPGLAGYPKDVQEHSRLGDRPRRAAGRDPAQDRQQRPYPPGRPAQDDGAGRRLDHGRRQRGPA